jgi:hypothetical protein
MRLSSSPRRVALLAFVVASLATAPVSWVMDGVTPSFVVYPLVLIVGLWRHRRGAGTLYFAVAGSIFLLVHVPFVWAALSDSGSNPFDESGPYNPTEWLVTLLLLPLGMVVTAVLAWREARRDGR